MFRVILSDFDFEIDFQNKNEFILQINIKNDYLLKNNYKSCI